MDDIIFLHEDVDSVTMSRDSAKAKFEKAVNLKNNLPKLEQTLTNTKGELASASKKLPDNFLIENVLQKTAMIAQDVGIELRSFDPGRVAPSGSTYKYAELPISVQIFGTFSQIASFLDRIVHLELLIHIENLQLELSSLENKTPAALDLSNKINLLAFQKRSREFSRLTGTVDIVIYRTLNHNERSAISVAASAERKK